MELTKELSVVEVAKLENAECCIADNIEEVKKRGEIIGRSLVMIQEERLYRTSHEEFYPYCKDRWGFTRQRADQLMNFVKIKDSLQPVVALENMPQHERQTRPLVALPEEERAEAWQEAVSESNGTPTAKDVEAVVERRKPIAAKPGPSADEVTEIEDELDKWQDFIDDRWSNGVLAKGQFMKVVYQAVTYAKAKK